MGKNRIVLTNTSVGEKEISYSYKVEGDWSRIFTDENLRFNTHILWLNVRGGG